MEDPEVEELRHMLLVQQSHELLCPDCDACITHHVILKRKREFHEPSTSKSAAEHFEEEQGYDDPDSVLPRVLLEQETHELFCPVCEYSVTDKLILQKRKRDRDSEILEFVEESDVLGESWKSSPRRFQWKSSPRRFHRDSSADVAEWDEFYMRTVLQQQKTFDLLCPDCDACITHEVVLQKRKRVVSTSSESAPEGAPLAQGMSRVRLEEIVAARQETHRRQQDPDLRNLSHRVREIEELQDSEQVDPPLKKQRKTFPGTSAAEDSELRRIFQEQTTHDLTCPDCHSRITYQMILRRKTRRFKAKTWDSEQIVPEIVHLLEDKQGRRPGKSRSVNYVDKNPWKTRYKFFYRGLRGISSAADERDETRSRMAKYGAVTSRSLTQSLIPQSDAAAMPPMTIVGRYYDIREFLRYNWRNSWAYFATMLFLWFIWYILRLVYV